MSVRRLSFGVRTGIGIFTIMLLSLFGVYLLTAANTRILGIIFLALAFIRLLTLVKALFIKHMNKRDQKELERLERLKDKTDAP